MSNQFIHEDEHHWFDDFFHSMAFAEALGIVWGYGTESTGTDTGSFLIRCADYTTVKRFSTLVKDTRPVYHRVAYIRGDKNKPYDQWVCGMRSHHYLDTVYDKKIDFVKPRLRINGTKDVLDHMSHFLSNRLGVGKKKVQNKENTSRTKLIYYSSKKEIPKILAFINDADTLATFNNLKLGHGVKHNDGSKK